MVAIRPTKMLARQLGVRLPSVPPEVPSQVADWCAHTFPVGRRSWLIFCNTASLYSVFAQAHRVTDGEALARRLRGMVLKVVRQSGFFSQAEVLADALTDFQWAPIPDRSVLGSINELIWLAGTWLEDPGLTPEGLSKNVNRAPMSGIGMNSPDRAFASLTT